MTCAALLKVSDMLLRMARIPTRDRRGDTLAGTLLCGLILPISMLLLKTTYMASLWTDASQKLKGRSGQRRRRGARGDLEDAVLAITICGCVLLIVVCMGLAAVIDREGAEAMIPGVFLGTQGIGWVIGERVTGFAASHGAGLRSLSLAGRMIPHGLVAWGTLIVIVAQPF